MASAMTVNTINDETTPSDSACSLREAIAAVSAQNGGTDCGPVDPNNQISLPAGHYVLSPTLGELLFAQGPTVTINGANPSDPTETWIDAAGTPAIPRRVMEIAAFGGATLNNVEIAGGLSASGVIGASAGQSGTPGANGGGILNNSHGALILDHALVTDNFTGSGGRGANSAGDGGGAGSGNSGGSGGGIYSDSNSFLSITASTISGNGTGGGGAGGNGGIGHQGVGHFAAGTAGGQGAYSGSGGGIFISTSGTATIDKTTISGNFTGVGGTGGDGGQGAGELGGPSPSGAGTGGNGGRGGNGSLDYSTYDGHLEYGNTAGGGGIANAGTLTMTASTISGNFTGAGGHGGGGGIGGENLNATFQNGGSGGMGGSAGLGAGLLHLGTASGSGATLTNVTIAANQTGVGATGGSGGQGTSLGGGPGGFGGNGAGIWAVGASNGNDVQLTHVTVSQNHLGAGGLGGDDETFQGIPGERGKGAGITTGGRNNPAAGAAGVYLKNTLIAGNGVPASGDVNCVQYYPTAQYVDFYDLGHNINFPNDGSCPGATGDPLLGPLQNNGGPTETMLPAAGSSAIGGVPSASCTVHVDQRGLTRPGGSSTSCDIGAVETGLAAPLLQLSVLKSGSGAGTVTSSPAGIDCGATCAADFGTGQLVTLTATPTSGSFSGWSGGGCTGTGTCQVTLNSNTQVTASFAADSTPPPGGGGGATPTPPAGPTGQRAAALKKCKKKKGSARASCIKKAKKLPV
jgi:CSLREA domain-containing protein